MQFVGLDFRDSLHTSPVSLYSCPPQNYMSPTPTKQHEGSPWIVLLTEFEEAIPGVAELFPGFGDDWSEPFGNGSGVHGSLEGTEHEVQGIDVLKTQLGYLLLQAAQSPLIQDHSNTCYPKQRSQGLLTFLLPTWKISLVTALGCVPSQSNMRYQYYSPLISQTSVTESSS